MAVTLSIVEIFMIMLAVFLSGMGLGLKIAAGRWASNADVPYRILYSGELYKVYRMTPPQGPWYDPGGWLKDPRTEAQKASFRVDTEGKDEQL